MPRSSYLPRYSRMLLALLALLALCSPPARAASSATRTLVPIGAGYADDTLQRFAQAAAQHDTSGNVYLLVLPITYATNAYAISNGERNTNLTLADGRRAQVEDACNAVKAPAQTCTAVLAPILVRADALQSSNLDLFTPNLDGLYILGGDQTIAMHVVADTPTEQRMAAAYAAGVVVGGNSAGAAVESLNMIAGYTGNNGPENGLAAGSVDLWTSQGQADQERGLIFGASNALFDQHVLQRGRIGRLINASWETKLLGLGADADTAAPVVNEATLTDVVGSSAAFVVDIKTYGSQGHYAGPTESLAISRVATHVLPAGGYGYDLVALRPLVGGLPVAAPDIAGREFGKLKLRRGYGTLLLGGDISGDKSGLVAQRFVAASGPGAKIVVLAAGYAKSSVAQAEAKAYAAAFQSLGASAQWFVLDGKANQAAIQAAIGGATGVFLTAPDQSRIKAALDNAAPIVTTLRARWQAGMAWMADNAAAAALGQTMTANPPPPSDTAGLEAAAVASFRPSSVVVQPGLGLVPGVAFEPRLLPDRHWGQLYNILYADKSVLGMGIDVNTAVELTQSGATAVGASAVTTLDGRYAAFGLGSNGALGARWVILDTFVDEGSIKP
jgi:cyanophycinase